MSDTIFQSFLEAQHERGLALVSANDRVTLEPMAGDPPYCYLARFNCHGLVQNSHGGIENHDRWAIGIRLPDNYLKTQVHVAEILTFLGPPHIFHPNFRPPFVCLTVRPGTPLDELLYSLYDLLTWNVYGVGDDGLNPGAAQWARHQPAARFPLDRRPLRRVVVNPSQP